MDQVLKDKTQAVSIPETGTETQNDETKKMITMTKKMTLTKMMTVKMMTTMKSTIARKMTIWRIL